MAIASMDVVEAAPVTFEVKGDTRLLRNSAVVSGSPTYNTLPFDVELGEEVTVFVTYDIPSVGSIRDFSSTGFTANGSVTSFIVATENGSIDVGYGFEEDHELKGSPTSFLGGTPTDRLEIHTGFGSRPAVDPISEIYFTVLPFSEVYVDLNLELADGSVTRESLFEGVDTELVLGSPRNFENVLVFGFTDINGEGSPYTVLELDITSYRLLGDGEEIVLPTAGGEPVAVPTPAAFSAIGLLIPLMIKRQRSHS